MSLKELTDVYDEHGEKTGEVKTREEIFKSGEWRLVVHVCVVDKGGQLLIQQRVPNKGVFDSCWDVSVGGGVAAGEDSHTSAQREVLEELGLDFSIDKFHKIGRFKVPKIMPERNQTTNEFSDVYVVLCDAISLDDINIQELEVARVELIPAKKLFDFTLMSDREWVPHGTKFYEDVTKSLHDIIYSER